MLMTFKGGRNNPLQSFEFGLQYQLQPLAVNIKHCAYGIYGIFPLGYTKHFIMEKHSLRFENCLLKDSLGNQRWWFYGITRKTHFETFIF